MPKHPHNKSSVFTVRTTDGMLMPVLVVDGPDDEPTVVMEVIRFMSSLTTQGESFSKMQSIVTVLGMLHDFVRLKWDSAVEPESLPDIVAAYLRQRRSGADEELGWEPVKRETVDRDRHYLRLYSEFCADRFGYFPLVPSKPYPIPAGGRDYKKLLRHLKGRGTMLLAHLIPTHATPTRSTVNIAEKTVKRRSSGKTYMSKAMVEDLIMATRSVSQRLVFIQAAFGGQRISEILNQWRCDVLPGRFRPVMIEAGLPPDMVQDVAGHATIVMTLYYNKIKASKLNASMAAVLDDMSVKLDGIDALVEADYERLSEFLLNTRDPEDAVGKSLLGERMSKGDGAVDVMTHGICPGGECASGGEFANQAVGYLPVSRPLACSLCRYRLTGPMFLPGLVLNANKLMHELRRKGQEIARLQEEREALEDAGKSSHRVRASIEALYRETDIVAAEWAAEVQYVHLAEAAFTEFIADNASGEPNALVVGLDGPAIGTQLNQGSEFSLLQNLAEGAAIWPGFKPAAALDDHREFLNEVLAANDIDPFLLRLRGDIRDRAAVLLGRSIAKFVPDENMDALRSGDLRIDEFPAITTLISGLKEQALNANIVPGSTLVGLEEAILENA